MQKQSVQDWPDSKLKTVYRMTEDSASGKYVLITSDLRHVHSATVMDVKCMIQEESEEHTPLIDNKQNVSQSDQNILAMLI